MAVKPSQELVPWYRNVKTIAIVAQLVFVALIILLVTILVLNVMKGVKTLGVNTGFGFLNNRAGFPISESVIPYSEDNTYVRALIVGILNTLKVALLGIVLATLLGISVALMRLSNNWVLRQISTIYIETVRNIPLVVQIFFFATVLFIPNLPSGVAALRLGNLYLNNSSGLITPWPYFSNNFWLWLPWLAIALALAIAAHIFRNRHLKKIERPGNPLWLSLPVFLLVAVIGYLIALAGSKYPEHLTVSADVDRGRVFSFIDENANGVFDQNAEKIAAKVPVLLEFDELTLEVNPQRRTEQKANIRSAFAFPRLKKNEYGEVEHQFVNADKTSDLRLHFFEFPSYGVVYKDQNGNGRFDAGENVPEGEDGYEGKDYSLQMIVKGFKRRVVTDNYGETRSLSVETATEPKLTLLGASPMVMSYPYFPTERTQIAGGTIFTIPYLALLFALTFYTASFIAEIVRGAILSVAKGQTEAAKALGLSSGQTFNLVVFPQALRIITPPLISQYLNLTKNSSLGIFAAYQEFYAVSSIVNNQSGAAMPVFVILIGGYMVISLTFSFALNWYNAKNQLVER